MIVLGAGAKGVNDVPGAKAVGVAWLKLRRKLGELSL